MVSIRIPVFEPKNEEFELEFRLFVPPGQYGLLRIGVWNAVGVYVLAFGNGVGGGVEIKFGAL